MSSVDISQIPGIVARDAYPAMFQAYDAEQVVFPRICEVRTAPPGMLGDKGYVIAGLGDPMVLRDGQEVPADSFEQAYTWRIKIDRWGRRLDIPKRLMEAADASEKIPAMISEFSRNWGSRFALKKDEFVAGIFQKGTIAAGNRTYFDNSFPNETDSNAGFIYDGKPFFAATGNGHPLASNSATPFNLTAALALSSSNIQTVLTTMRDTNAVDDRGQKIMVNPNVLVIPPALEFSAKTILNSVQVAGSANNDANVIRGALDPIVWRYLTDDTDSWYVGEAGKGVRVYDGGQPRLETMYDAKTQTMSIVAITDFGAGVVDWRPWYACNKATT